TDGEDHSQRLSGRLNELLSVQDRPAHDLVDRSYPKVVGQDDVVRQADSIAQDVPSEIGAADGNPVAEFATEVKPIRKPLEDEQRGLEANVTRAQAQVGGAGRSVGPELEGIELVRVGHKRVLEPQVQVGEAIVVIDKRRIEEARGQFDEPREIPDR